MTIECQLVSVGPDLVTICLYKVYWQTTKIAAIKMRDKVGSGSYVRQVSKHAILRSVLTFYSYE